MNNVIDILPYIEAKKKEIREKQEQAKIKEDLHRIISDLSRYVYKKVK